MDHVRRSDSGSYSIQHLPISGGMRRGSRSSPRVACAEFRHGRYSPVRTVSAETSRKTCAADACTLRQRIDLGAAGFRARKYCGELKKNATIFLNSLLRNSSFRHRRPRPRRQTCKLYNECFCISVALWSFGGSAEKTCVIWLFGRDAQR